MKKIILVSLIFWVSATALKSQVTIGSSIEPVKGALLDLKTKNADASTNETVSANQAGGLVFPRIRLVNAGTLEPFIATGSVDWNASNQDQTKKIHTGMMVYNLKDTDGFSPGIYVWNGTQWLKDRVSADNGLTKSGNAIQLGGTLSDSTTINQGSHALNFVGGTGNMNGKIYLSNVKNNVPTNTDSIVTLGIDNHTGELFAMKANNGGASTKAINYVVYQLKGSGDCVKNFNTRIKVKDYTLVVVGSNFKMANFTSYAGVKPLPGVTVPVGTTFISSVYADTKFDTTTEESWIIHADYLGARPADEANGTWTIYCLVVNNALVNAHVDNPISYPNGTENITAPNAPSGLQ
jgi:hypothetical protein